MKADLIGRRLGDVVTISLRAGLVAGAAMMPFGMALRALGYRVNVYGELVVRTLLGSAPMAAQLAFHAVVSITLAAPFVALARWRGLSRVTAGASYGALSWAALNATLLPLWFRRPTGWALGLREIWPSLLVHLVFGVALAAITARAAPSVGRNTRRGEVETPREQAPRDA